MNNDIAAQCEQSFYEELYHYTGGKRCLVMDKVSEHIYMRKTLEVYHAEVFQYLKEHPNPHIPRIQTFWQEGRRLVVIEELIAGVSLEYLLENAKPDHTDRLAILHQICDGLIFLHGAYPPIIHRDLKLSNVMVTDDGIVKIIDYDAAKPLNNLQEHDTVLIGTHGYAAPEQYGFGKCDVRTDIYGLGGMIRAMFPDDPQMMQIADKATQLDPAARYQTVQELRADLPGGETAAQTMDGLADENNETENANPTFLQRLCQVPGFRTRKLWKMVLAVLIYLMIVYEACTMTPSNPSATNPLLDTWLYRFTVLGAMFSVVDAVTEWTGIFSRFPFVHSSYPILRVAGDIFASFIGICLWGTGYALIAVLLGLT